MISSNSKVVGDFRYFYIYVQLKFLRYKFLADIIFRDTPRDSMLDYLSHRRSGVPKYF